MPNFTDLRINPTCALKSCGKLFRPETPNSLYCSEVCLHTRQRQRLTELAKRKKDAAMYKR